jgi:hypothetical protein
LGLQPDGLRDCAKVLVGGPVVRVADQAVRHVVRLKARHEVLSDVDARAGSCVSAHNVGILHTLVVERSTVQMSQWGRPRRFIAELSVLCIGRAMFYRVPLKRVLIRHLQPDRMVAGARIIIPVKLQASAYAATAHEVKA